MNLNLLKKIKLFHVNFRRTHEIIYMLIYRAYMIMAVIFVLIGSGYFYGQASFEDPHDALEMFSMGAWYIVITVIIVPLFCAITKWKKYLFPGTYKNLSRDEIKEILNNENFINPISILEEREKKHDFLESKNFFSFNKQLIPKSAIEAFHFENYGNLKSYNRYYTFEILLKNGNTIKNIHGELDETASKYKDKPISDYLENYLKNSGFDNKHLNFYSKLSLKEIKKIREHKKFKRYDAFKSYVKIYKQQLKEKGE